MRARRFHDDDYLSYGLILAMDDENLEHLQARCPAERRPRLARLMDFAPPGLPRAVPDPYYRGGEAFEQALDLIEVACDGLARYLHSQQGGREPEHGR